MEIQVKSIDVLGNIRINLVSGEYLTKFVKANKKYQCSYYIDEKGKRKNIPAFVLGRDLTEGQIIDLFCNERL